MGLAEAAFIRSAAHQELDTTVEFNRKPPAPERQGGSSKAVKYANKRYWIPFGWWANPNPSLASTSWAMLVDKQYNPFFLGGGYNSSYPDVPSPVSNGYKCNTDKWTCEPAAAGLSKAA